MVLNNEIDAPHPEIAEQLDRWATIRDFIKGERAVKKAGLKYLPPASSQQTTEEYCYYKDYVTFFPAVARTLEQFLGLMFRRTPVFETNGSEKMELIAKAVTRDGRSLNQLGWDVAKEALATNFAGLLVDPPAKPDAQDPTVSAANEIERGFRPFLAPYTAGSILEASRGVVSNMSKLVRVRLLEDAGATVRELVLEDGIYVVYLHKKNAGGQWQQPVRTVPEAQGRPLTEIPFEIISTSNKMTPEPALLDHLVNLNLNHYRTQGLLTIAHILICSPVPFICGIDRDSDEARDLSMAPGNIWLFESHETQVGFNEFTGAGVDKLENAIAKIEAHCAMAGARMLAGEKSAVEAAETHQIRRASENSILAAAANNVSAGIERSLNRIARWIGEGEVRFALNTDYLPQKMSAQEITAMVGAWQAGTISDETLFYSFRDGEVLNQTLEYEEERARRDATPVQSPPAAL